MVLKPRRRPAVEPDRLGVHVAGPCRHLRSCGARASPAAWGVQLLQFLLPHRRKSAPGARRALPVEPFARAWYRRASKAAAGGRGRQ